MKTRLKLVVGLGNPGEDYRLTRHNAGALAVKGFGQKAGFHFRRDRSFRSLVAEGPFGDARVALVLPQTFMNLSGEAVVLFVSRRDIALEDILIVSDDADLPLGTLRIRDHGTDGGHQGLASVLRCLKTRKIARLRLGIGRQGAPRGEISDYVLSKFSKGEQGEVAGMLARAAAAVETWILEGISACMNRFNAQPQKRSCESHEQI